MHGIQFDRFGGSGVLALTETTRPIPTPTQILVKLVSSSVNPIDLMIRRGEYPKVRSDKLPYLGGRDAAGIVAQVGIHVADEWLGRPVFGMPEMDRGTFAEYVVLNLSEVAVAPSSVALQDLGSVPLAALTAWQGLHLHGHIQPGQKVLIQGASGGVGHFAVQIAKAAGAKVYATASRHNLAFLEELGTDIPIAYDLDDPGTFTKDIDLMLDLVGGATVTKSLGLMRPGGSVISTVIAPDAAAVAAAKIGKGAFFIAASSGDDLAKIAGLMDSGKLKVSIGQRYRLCDTALAQDRLDHGGVPGKIAIAIA